MKKQYWYFKIEQVPGRVDVVVYGDSDKYTQEQAIEGIKRYCKEKGCKYIGIHKW